MFRERVRRGFTLIELLVVIAIIAILIALLVPAVQAVRESANRTQCMNQMRQIALAIYQFQSVNKTLPTYDGSYPAASNGYTRYGGTLPFGGWMFHILPYIEQEAFYKTVMADIEATGTNINSSTGGVAGTPTGAPAPPPYTATVTINGITYTYDVTPGAPTSGGVSATTVLNGIFKTEYSTHIFPFARCPSDPSAAPDQMVETFAPTNYMANFNALFGSNGDGSSHFDMNRTWAPKNWGYYTKSTDIRKITDGLTNTVLLAEGYANCDGRSRVALRVAAYHNFGITAGASQAVNVSVSGGILPVGGPYDLTNGMPNAFMFQVKPLTKTATQCPAGSSCCERWRAQTPHSAMPVAMMDASVRTLSEEISQDTWTRLMLPRDGMVIEGAW